MKKTYILENLDCAHCAAKIEEAVGRLDGVESASVAFMTGKMVVEGPEEIFEDILPKIEKAAKKIEPDVEIKSR